jgi:hypothetical protein
MVVLTNYEAREAPFLGSLSLRDLVNIAICACVVGHVLVVFN